MMKNTYKIAVIQLNLNNTPEKNLKKIPDLLTVLDNSLADKKYLAGNEFTLGDINTSSVISICPMIGIDLGTYPNIKNWLGAISDRPAFQKYQTLRK